MAIKYLDNNGLVYLWQQIESKISAMGFSGSYNDLTDKPAIPSKTSDLTNDSQYQTLTQVSDAIASSLTSYATKEYVTDAVSDIVGFSAVIVESLPTTGDANKMYLVAITGTTSNVYEEYMWINETWEIIGTTDIDLSQYLLKTDLEALTNSEINSIITLAES